MLPRADGGQRAQIRVHSMWPALLQPRGATRLRPLKPSRLGRLIRPDATTAYPLLSLPSYPRSNNCCGFGEDPRSGGTHAGAAPPRERRLHTQPLQLRLRRGHHRRRRVVLVET